MKKLLLIPVLLALAFPPLLQAQETIRQKVNFNREWKFKFGDHSGAGATSYDDAKWEAVGLPHSFSMPCFAANNKFPVGYGWYRKHFDVPVAWEGRRVSIEFEGAFQDAEIFLNGKKVGRHLGGYTGFSIDLTNAVKTGDNVVAVRLNNLWNARLAPRAGEHTFSGGLYRDVFLVATNPLHVAWCGTFVTTPQVSRESGTVNVKTEIVNDSEAEKLATVKTQLLDPDGRLVGEMESTLPVSQGGTVVFDQTSKPVANPKLWHPDHPHLYTVKTTVLDGGKAVDDFTSPLGFRWFKFTADAGFFLNGEHRYFKGANVHQDHAGWGDAVTNAGFERDVKMVKEAGMDFIRGSHYPHDPAFSEACDREGMLFWSENCFWGTGGQRADGYWSASAYPVKAEDEAEFEQSVIDSLRDMIRIHRNHPSIIVWSMCNEVFFSSQQVMPKVRDFLKRLVAITHELDPTRPAAIGGCQRGDLDKLGDVAGYNGDGARLFLEPGIPSVVTEYGSVMSERPGRFDPGWNELQTVPGMDKKQIGAWRFPWRSGEALWCAFDHASIAGKKFGAMGMIDFQRLPKRAWYWYRNEYNHIPPPEWPVAGTPAGIRLAADKAVLASVDGTDDTQLIVSIVDKDGRPLSNSVPVTLTIESGPGEFPTGPSISFAPDSDITIRDGQAAIEFRSYHAGETVIRATSQGLRDATIKIVSKGTPAFIVGRTPPTQPRSYVRFEGQPADTLATSKATVMSFGLENPTRNSSEAPGHSSRMGNDGNASTFWQAANAAPNAWWQVDLERVVALTKTKLTFPTEGNYRYKIEVSEDALGWTLAVDRSQTSETEKIRSDAFPKPVTARFVRITFTALPAGESAALSEMEAFGALRDK